MQGEGSQLTILHVTNATLRFDGITSYICPALVFMQILMRHV